MIKRLHKSLIALSVVALSAMSGSYAYAEGNIEGYFRVQSALCDGVKDNGYVEVHGPMTVAPDCSYADALTSAGTVMRLRALAETDPDGNVRYKIGNLSSQGIEVFGAPVADYEKAMSDIVTSINTNDYTAAAYGIQRAARKVGYIATCRAIVESLFYIVAARLDDEVAGLTAEQKASLGYQEGQESLADFAKRFNTEVSEKEDLYAYLEPVAGKDGDYRLYFHWLDCTAVEAFYKDEANPQNRKSFELGFECMRQYMKSRHNGLTGERIDLDEAALWRSWGYDIDKDYASLLTTDADGIKYYALSYEKIFADHNLLYNWLKMNIERFLDPEKAPDMEILGINFREFASAMQQHAIMQGFLKYIPSIQEGQKLYLTSGRFSDGVNEYSTVGTVSDNSEHFGLLAQDQADEAGPAAVWHVRPIDENTDNYFAFEPTAWRRNKPGEEENAYYAAMYFDFPVAAVEANVTFTDINEALQSTTLENLGDVKYIDYGTEKEAARLTPIIIETKSLNLADNKLRIIYEAQESDHNPAVNKVRSRVTADQGSVFGVLIGSNADAESLSNMHDITLNDDESVYHLSTRSGVLTQSGKNCDTPWFHASTAIPSNHSVMIARTDTPTGAIALGAPVDLETVTTGIENVSVDRMVDDEAIYDLQGRRVTEPVSGHLYFSKGKKFIAE